MGEQEKRQTISAERAALLAAMGVQVWYSRAAQPTHTAPVTVDEPFVEQQAVPAAPLANESAQTPPETTDNSSDQPAAAAPVQAIEFIWLKGTSGMLWLPLAIDPAALQLAKDAVVFADWARQQPAGGVAQGDFRWPQLLDTNGTPERSLKVFIDKHLPAAEGWLAVSGEVVEQVEPWLGSLHKSWLVLPELHGRADDVDTKKKLWQSLKQSS